MTSRRTRESLEALSASELKALAREANVEGISKLRKEALIEVLLAPTPKAETTSAGPKVPAKKAPVRAKAAADGPAPQGAPPTPQAAEAPVGSTQPVTSAEPQPAHPSASPLARWVYEQRVAEAKYAVTKPVELLREDEQLGELPGSYGTDVLTLLPLNPSRAYAHWDVDYRRLGEHYQGLSDGRPVVRLFRAGSNGQFLQFSELDIDLGAHNHYFPVDAGACYAAELGLCGADGYRKIASSNVLAVPTDRVAEAGDAPFVSVPLDAPLPLAGSRQAPNGFTVSGKVLTRAEYEHLFGKGVPLVPGSRHR